MDTTKIIDTMKNCMSGFRNDGKTPSWQHPLDVLETFDSMVRETSLEIDEEHLHSLRITCILHDILEDGKIDGRKFTYIDLASLIGYNVGQQGPACEYNTINAITALTKNGNTSFGSFGLIEYFTDQIAYNAYATIVKGCDRISNLRTAENDFSPYRLERYKWETKMFVIPMFDILDGYDEWKAWILNELVNLSYTEGQPRKT